jgi:hypothetical protein
MRGNLTGPTSFGSGGADFLFTLVPDQVPGPEGRFKMAKRFKVGDHVKWNSEAGRVSGTIIAIHTHDFDYKGHVRHASPDDPQYEIKSDKTDHIAAHKGSALDHA